MIICTRNFFGSRLVLAAAVLAGIAIAFTQISLSYAQDHSITQIEELIAALRSPNGTVREEAITSLARIGLTAAPALTAALGDADLEVRQGATVALERIG